MILKLVPDGTQTISAGLLSELHNDRKVVDSFELVGLNILDVHSFFDTLCKISGTHELDIDAFVEAAFQMKGFASSINLQTLLFQIQEMGHLMTRMEKFQLREMSPMGKSLSRVEKTLWD